MSDTLPDLEEKFLYAIIRKPQEGKTFICIENIKQSDDRVHIIITMNTIKSNEQFYNRLSEHFTKEKLVVFNSKQYPPRLRVTILSKSAFTERLSGLPRRTPKFSNGTCCKCACCKRCRPASVGKGKASRPVRER